MFCECGTYIGCSKRKLIRCQHVRDIEEATTTSEDQRLRHRVQQLETENHQLRQQVLMLEQQVHGDPTPPLPPPRKFGMVRGPRLSRGMRHG
ncbi:hypothetical protein AAVH_22514 [Aphelenchoides avenae]|nr:hypothetical protein AAVH_22514 [Aphelenchus avenae]